MGCSVLHIRVATPPLANDMSTKNPEPDQFDSAAAVRELEEQLRQLRSELREAKARSRKLESGGVDSGPMVDQYDRPVVDAMRERDNFFAIEGVRSLYRSAGITSTEKVKERLRALTSQGVIERDTIQGQYVWYYNDDE